MFDVENQMQIIQLLRFHHFVNEIIEFDRRRQRQDDYHIDYQFLMAKFLRKFKY
jgi:hypothetical protein